jgi:hypothetical protein
MLCSVQSVYRAQADEAARAYFARDVKGPTWCSACGCHHVVVAIRLEGALGFRRPVLSLPSRTYAVASADGASNYLDVRLAEMVADSLQSSWRSSCSLAFQLIADGLSTHARVIQVAAALFKKGGISKLKMSPCCSPKRRQP